MSLPINPGPFDPSLFASLLKDLEKSPSPFVPSPLAAPTTGSRPTSIPTSYSDYDLALEEAQQRIRYREVKITPERTKLIMEAAPDDLHYERMFRERIEHIQRMQMMAYLNAAPPSLVTSLFGSELRRPATDTAKKEETSASSPPSTPAKPSRSSTAASNLSGGSVLTSFLSNTLSGNSGSTPTGSRSGPPKLLPSPSKAIAMKSSTRRSRKS